ncbi:hypothetical protein ACVDG5_034565 [Mesorhizobium sp. ORM6]
MNDVFQVQMHVSAKEAYVSGSFEERPDMLQEISAPPDALSARLFGRGRFSRSHHALRLCDPKPRGALQREGANLADLNGQRFRDLNNTFAILMHRDGFAPALDAVARILLDGSRLLNSTAHDIDLAELPARLFSGGRADPFRQNRY